MVFGRRKRSASAHHQPLSPPASQSAQSAASHAFLRSQPSTSSLSSAAAAAALRNSTPTPTSIRDVETKRMVQRRASTQSQASPVGGRRSASVSGTLRRSSSNSSMTARTFREQSPHRPATSSGPVDVPPLPSLPTQYGQRKPPNGRAMSMGPSMRSPPSSPPRAGRVNREQGRGSPIHIDTHQRVTSLGTVPEFERSASRISANFSYPNLSRPISPTKEHETDSLNLAGALQKSALEESEQTPKKKPRARVSGSVEGSPVANKNRGPLAASAAAEALNAQKGSPQQKTRTEQVHDKPVEDESDQFTDNAGPIATSVAESEHPTSRTLSEGRPSTVREETEPTEETVETQVRQGRNRMTSASPTTDHLEAVPEKAGHAPHIRQSNSPGRARFSQLLSVADEGNQIHQPPPRSVSPFKSALKHHRGSSLSPERNLSTTNRAPAASELSDGGTSVASDEGSRFGTKKKAPKVSFDDEAEIVGVAASPPTSPEDYTPDSPPGGKAKNRVSFFGKKKSDPATHDDGFNAVIKPRQALPSFGSVRGNRKGGLQRSPIPDFSDNESTSSDNEAAAPPVALSNDHAIGNMLSKTQDHGYFKPRDVSTLEQMSVNGATVGTGSGADRESKPIGITERKPYSSMNSDLSVPDIAIEPATPPLDDPKRSLEQQRSSMDQYKIPGGFPPGNSDRNPKSTAKKTNAQAVIASAVPNLDDVDTEGESGDSVYSDAAEDIDGDGFGSINAIVDSRSAPRSVSASDTASESRDATPKALDRTAIVDTQSRDVPEQAEEVRSATPTQGSVNREGEESPISPVKARNLESAYPPLPINTNFHAPQNETIGTQPNGKQRPLSMAVGPTSRVQDPRWPSNESSPRDGNSRTRPMSLGPAFQKPRPTPRRTMSSGSDSSNSFTRTSPRGNSAHPMRRTMRNGAAPVERNESPIDHRPMSAASSNGTGTMRKTLRGTGAGNERYSFFSTNKKAPRAKVSKQPPKAAGSTRFVDSDGEEDEARARTFHSRFESSDEEEPGTKTMRPVRGIPRRQGADDGDSTELDDSSEEGHRQQTQPAAAPKSILTPPGSRGRNEPQSMSGMAAVAKQRGMSQRDLEEFLLSPPRGRKPGLLTRLGLKKDKNVEHRIRKADVESPSRRDTHLERSRLERDQLREDNVVNGTHGSTVTTVTAGSPEQPHHSKLVKRSSKQNTTGPSWPLRPDPADEESLQSAPEQSAIAPSSSQRTENSNEPQINAAPVHNGTAIVNGDDARGASPIGKEPGPIRRESRTDSHKDSTSEITNPDDHGPSARDVVIAGSGRKKRFPMLRKAFGLKA
ncbi:hypothetical protein N7508_002007 [Penicillium antarcticum]|uniref:uncharacterized protein n=1 Tax=Penicillium antarcticum TaxID=416450 RepID=UPI00239B0C14|nr:uncharacterized protein N7508_002007 [Penicillium antarcticum]KAJ5317499.1 hypothetical protein N7508_002007 [Penicillium antarcticum]